MRRMARPATASTVMKTNAICDSGRYCSAAGISVCDSGRQCEFRYTFCDESHARLFGKDRADVEGEYLWDVRGRAFFEREVRQPIQRCLAGEPPPWPSG